MSDPIGTLLLPALAAPRHRQPDRRRRRRHRADAGGRRSTGLGAERGEAAAGGTPRRAERAGRHVGINPQQFIAPSRAVGHRLRAELPRLRSSSMTRISRGATRRRRSTAAPTGCRPGSPCSCSRRASSTGTASRAGRSSRSRSTATSISTRWRRRRQLFAWAHTQITGAVGSGTTPDLAQLDAVLKASPEKGVSRLMSPRRLDPDTAYFAFVVPTYEIGRRSGLGEEIAASALRPRRRLADAARISDLSRVVLPHRRARRFRGAGAAAEAAPSPTRGSASATWTCVRPASAWARRPTRPTAWSASRARWWRRPRAPHGLNPASDFTTKLAPIVNAPADQVAAPVIGGDDPVVAPPIYGHWHALVDRLDRGAGADGWLARFNADPRYRAAAGLGSRVIKKNQEAYMRRPGEQIGEVLRANEAINRTQLAHASQRAATYMKSVAGLAEVAAPRGDGADVCARPRQPDDDPPRLPARAGCRARPSPAFRKLTRPRGLVARRSFANRGGAAPLRLSAARAVNERRATAVRRSRAHHRHMGVRRRATALRHSRLAEAAPQGHGAPGDPRNR